MCNAAAPSARRTQGTATGCQLASLSDGTTTWNYTYDSNGMRTGRTNGATTYSYVYNGSQLVQMTVGADTLRFTYDAAGTPLTVTYNGTTYYYVTNLQGDVVAIVNAGGVEQVRYTYGAWGQLLATEGTLATTLGVYNPLRYRGYVYDTETALYYLQTRYYDPEVGRFINADNPSYLGTDGITSYNLFSYCGNNPVMGYDPTGCWDWGFFTDIVTTVVAATTAFTVGVTVGVTTLVTTGSPTKAIAAGVVAGTATLGAINNGVNAVYYNYISDGESNLEEDPNKSSYVDEYVTRWDRLDHTKHETKEDVYNFDAWSYHSEYSVHMYGWYATSWAYEDLSSPLYDAARKFRKAEVLPGEMDHRPEGIIGTIIWGIFGL